MQPPISSYGLIGDMRTAALVGLDGGVDWCCLPRFDSGSVFAALLDPGRGGTWRVWPADPADARQRYLPGTNILETTFDLGGGTSVEVVDFMPVGADGHPASPQPELHRRIRCHGEAARLRVLFQPRFEYAGRQTRLEVMGAGLYATDRTAQVLTLASAEPIAWTAQEGTASAELELRGGDERWMVLRYDEDDVQPVDRFDSAARLAATGDFWRRWAGGIRYHGPFGAEVERSALVLKLLTHRESGAIIAAPTTSLPETIGGGRNWDYRFVWLRDAAFTLTALTTLGHHTEADAFMRFLRRVCRHEGAGHLQIMYGIDGRRDLVERQLDHLAGYRGSRPVRVGNGAADQLQMDVYGEVLYTADQWRKHHPMTEGTWRVLHGLVDWVAANWQRPDSSIWEVRGEQRHYVFSKVMSWVALDRGLRIASELDLPAGEDWARAREALRSEILTRGWSDAKGAFTQAYDDEALDASALLFPMVRFVAWDDPRARSTIAAVQRELTSPDGELVYRYRSADGLEGEEGAFSMCTFWLAHCLWTIGERKAAERIFRRMLTHANHVGLYSEEIDPATGEFLGNFPQAFTHIALINCAAVFARVA